MTYHFIMHTEDEGFWAECVELDSCVSEGHTIPELKENLKEALDGVLSVSFGNNFSHPLPDRTLDGDSNLIHIEASPEVAFSVALRNYRITQRLTQNDMSKALHFKSRNSYVKLEKQGNPTFKTAGRIKQAFPDFPIQECFG